MSEEMIYKSQEKALMRDDRNRTAVVLIGGGLALLALTLSGVSLLEFLAPLVFISGLGALFMWPAYKSTAEHRRGGQWLAAPGALLLTLGLLIFFLGLIDRWEMMAYSWTLLPMSFVGGLMYGGRFNQTHRIHTNGPKIIRALGWMFALGGLFFELLVFESLGPWWPLVLVGYGLYLVFRQRRLPATS